jgi:uncharacterized protein YggT (Ycf19 family)
MLPQDTEAILEAFSVSPWIDGMPVSWFVYTGFIATDEYKKQKAQFLAQLSRPYVRPVRK